MSLPHRKRPVPGSWWIVVAGLIWGGAAAYGPLKILTSFLETGRVPVLTILARWALGAAVVVPLGLPFWLLGRRRIDRHARELLEERRTSQTWTPVGPAGSLPVPPEEEGKK